MFFIAAFLLAACVAGCKKSAPAWTLGQPLGKDDVKISIFFLDKAESGYSYAHDAGLGEAQRQSGLRDDQVTRRYNVNDADNSKVEHMMREEIAAGANIIIATSWGYMNVCEKLAAEFPNVVFAHASGYKYNETNFTNYFGRLYQARYISGVAAGLNTKTGKLGFVAAQDSTNSEVTSGVNAFALGVESVNPSARIYVAVTHSWYDPYGEYEATQKLIAHGCDMIALHSDTPRPHDAANKAGVLSIGNNIDMREYAPNSVLTSTVWNWGAYYTFLIRSVIDGTFTTEPFYGGLAEGVVDVAPLTEALAAPGTEEAVNAARNRIRNEKFNVFDGKMETNYGRVVGMDGQTLSDSEITGGINWYYRTVTVLR
jgi:basic membrane protein A